MLLNKSSHPDTKHGAQSSQDGCAPLLLGGNAGIAPQGESMAKRPEQVVTYSLITHCHKNMAYGSKCRLKSHRRLAMGHFAG